MSRPIIGRDWHGRTRTPRTVEEAFGYGQRMYVHKRRLTTAEKLDGAVMVLALLGGVVLLWLGLEGVL